MASSQSKIGWKWMRNRENKNSNSILFLHVIENSNNRAKKLKNMVVASFQAKIGWKMLRKRENKNYHSVSFLHDALQKSAKKQEKNSKNSKILLQLHFKPKQVGKVQERKKIKIFVPFRSYPARNRKFQENSEKIVKIKKYH